MKTSTKKLLVSALVMAVSGGVYAQAGGGGAGGGAGGGGGGPAGPGGRMVEPGITPAENLGGYGSPGDTATGSGPVQAPGAYTAPNTMAPNGAYSTYPNGTTDNDMNPPPPPPDTLQNGQ